MKKIILLTLMNIYLIFNAQFFNNSNGELCYQLYTIMDPAGEFRIFLVIDSESFTSHDSLILTKLGKLSYAQKSSIAQKWAYEGVRVESERFPYINYPPVFPQNKVDLNQIMKKLDHTINWETSPWKDARPFWLYKNRPF